MSFIFSAGVTHTMWCVAHKRTWFTFTIR
jgi:hypothetical protein